MDGAGGDGIEQVFRVGRVIVRKGSSRPGGRGGGGGRNAKHDVVVVMDGDGSHPRRRFRSAAGGSLAAPDIAVGSRFCEAVRRMPRGRCRAGEHGIRDVFGADRSHARDPMSGFAAFPKERV